MTKSMIYGQNNSFIQRYQAGTKQNTANNIGKPMDARNQSAGHHKKHKRNNDEANPFFEGLIFYAGTKLE